MSTDMIWQTVSTSSADTEKIAELLGKGITAPAVIELRSDLGGGKTTFVRGLARGLGSKHAVSSPTFTLNQIYKAKDGIKISHYDFYRLDDAGVMKDQIAESLEDKKTITVIEWAGLVRKVLPDDRIVIELRPEQNDSQERQITITYPENQVNLIGKLRSQWTSTKP